MDLRQLNEDQLTRLLEFTEKLADQQDEFANFGDADNVGQAEQQAKDYIKRRKASIRQIDDKEDAEIRKGIKNWLKRTGRLARYSR